VTAGAAVIAEQGLINQALGLGGSIDGMVSYRVIDNLAITLRAGTVICPMTTLYYAGPGIFMPQWHWGLTVGWGNAGIPEVGRENGVHFEVPYEIRLGSFFKINIGVGFGFYKDVSEQTLRLEIGF